LVLVALVDSDHKRGTVKKVSIHVITPSEGGRCNIVCCGIFIQMLVFSQIVVVVGLVDTWMVLLHIGMTMSHFVLFFEL
jgi:hypothetical protein